VLREPSTARAVVSDNGQRILLTVYYGREGYPVELTPLRAADLARKLLEAALPKLANIVAKEPKVRREPFLTRETRTRVREPYVMSEPAGMREPNNARDPIYVARAHSRARP
jgi:hypothetical protein